MSQTDVEFRKGKRTLDMKEKNNFLATANLRETEYISKRSRHHVEPSDDRYNDHLAEVNTPPIKKARTSPEEADSVATSSEKPVCVTAKKPTEEHTPDKSDPTDSGTNSGMSLVVRKAFLGLF